MNLLVVRLLVIAYLLLCSNVHAQKTVTQRRDSPVVKGLPIKCSGTDYTWTGMLREKENSHTLETIKAVNSTPLEVVILEKAGAVDGGQREVRDHPQ